MQRIVETGVNAEMPGGLNLEGVWEDLEMAELNGGLMEYFLDAKKMHEIYGPHGLPDISHICQSYKLAKEKGGNAEEKRGNAEEKRGNAGGEWDFVVDYDPKYPHGWTILTKASSKCLEKTFMQMPTYKLVDDRTCQQGSTPTQDQRVCSPTGASVCLEVARFDRPTQSLKFNKVDLPL